MSGRFNPASAGAFFIAVILGRNPQKHSRPEGPTQGERKLMKLKLDDQGHAVLQDGMPVYVYEDGKEVPFDAPAAMSKIGELNKENKGHRERAEKAETSLKVFEGLDPETARKALETVKNLDDKKLIDAGKVDEIKAEVTAAWKMQLEEQTKGFQAKLDEKDKLIGDRDGQIYSLTGTAILSAMN